MASRVTSTTKIIVEIDEDALFDTINNSSGLMPLLTEETDKITSKANTLSAGFRTGIWHDHATGQKRGNTQPKYVGDVERFGNKTVGIVHPKNYAAMKDNYLHNTLLKSL